MKKDAPMELPNLLWDFDGVLAEMEWPETGEPILNNLDLFRYYQEKGHRCFIYTSRDMFHLEMIEEFCRDFGIQPDGILTGKPLGILIDDMAVNPEVRNANIDGLCERLKKFWVRNLE